MVKLKILRFEGAQGENPSPCEADQSRDGARPARIKYELIPGTPQDTKRAELLASVDNVDAFWDFKWKSFTSRVQSIDVSALCLTTLWQNGQSHNNTLNQ